MTLALTPSYSINAGNLNFTSKYQLSYLPFDNEELSVFVPNTFTPNGDEFNNTFSAVIHGNVDPYHFTMTVFNRWGETVFESHNLSIGWDGTFNGSPVPDGPYAWKIQLKTRENDNKKVFVGHVNLIR